MISNNRLQAMIADYRSGLSLRQCAAKYGCSMQNIHQIIKVHAPNIMREPHNTQNQLHKVAGPVVPRLPIEP